MRYSMRIAVLLACLGALLSGCATMRYPGIYKIEGMEYKEFKDLDDDKALKAVALIYNVKQECREDDIARSIALEEYLNLLGKRKSPYIRDSGIFDTKYEKIKLSAWSDEELIDTYRILAPKALAYSNGSCELTEAQNAERITYLTAVGAIAREIKRRDLTQKAMTMAGQVISAALMVALSFI